MNKIRKYIINILLAFVVLILAFMPISISKIEEKNILGKLHTEDVKARKPIDNSLTSVEDKLELVVRYQKKDQNIVMIEKEKEELNDKEISSLVIRELKKMQTLNIFPNISLKDDIEIRDYSAQIFMDKNKPQGVVSILNICFSYDKYNFYVNMDANTYKIYEFDVYSKYQIPKINVSLLAESISKYLDVAVDKDSGYNYYDSKIYTLKHGKIKYAYSEDNNYSNLYLLIKEI